MSTSKQFREYGYIRLAITEDELERLLELLADQDDEPIVLKLQARMLLHQARRMERRS